MTFSEKYAYCGKTRSLFSIIVSSMDHSETTFQLGMTLIFAHWNLVPIDSESYWMMKLMVGQKRRYSLSKIASSNNIDPKSDGLMIRTM